MQKYNFISTFMLSIHIHYTRIDNIGQIVPSYRSNLVYRRTIKKASVLYELCLYFT